MSVWWTLRHLLPWVRRAVERDMEEELAPLREITPPGRLGSLTVAAENARAVWSWIWLEEFRQDAGYAIRTLRRTPTFTAAAVLTLAIGVGASTAIFSVVNAVFLRPLPYDDPDGIYRIRTMDARGLPLGQVGRAHIAPLNERSEPVQAAAYGFFQESSISGRDRVALPLKDTLRPSSSSRCSPTRRPWAADSRPATDRRRSSATGSGGTSSSPIRRSSALSSS